MRCRFKPTGEIHRCGREVWACQRRRCKVFGVEPPSGKLDARCEGFPDPGDYGDWVEFWIGVFLFSDNQWNSILVFFGLRCRCPDRKEWLNTLGGRLTTWAQSGDGFWKQCVRWLLAIPTPVVSKEAAAAGAAENGSELNS